MNKVKKDDFDDWLENPVTEYFMQYLKDSAKEEVDIITDAIFNGAIIPENEQISKSSICATLSTIADIRFEDIESFYQERKE